MELPEAEADQRAQRPVDGDVAPALAPTLGEPDPGLAPTIARAVVAVEPGHDLAAVLADAPAGTTIELAPGRYALPRPLTLLRSVRLLGAGAGRCEIVGPGPGHVLAFDGDADFEMSDLAIRHTGAEAACVVIVERGRFAFQGCTFTGGVTRDFTLHLAGCGLLVRGASGGTVMGCHATGNGGNGVALACEEAVTLEGNLLERNGRFGGWCGTGPRTTSAWRHNVMRLNGEGGWGLFERANATSEGDAFRENYGDGVVAAHQSRATLADPDVSLNRGWGLVLWGRGPYALTGARISHNKGAIHLSTNVERTTIDGAWTYLPPEDPELDAVVPAWFPEEPEFHPCEVCGRRIWDEYERCADHETKGDCVQEWCGVIDCLRCEPDGRRRPGVVIPRGGTFIWE